MGHEVQAARRPRRPRRHPPRRRRSGSRTSPSTCSKGFDDVTIFDQNVVSHLELLKLSYTGCNPRGLLLARDKSLSKKLLAYHRIPVPEFEVFRIGRPIRRPKRLAFPLIVKSLTQEASIGISQASVVDSDEKLKERVTFIHESIGTAAIVEQYIEGRELYVGILGNQALQALPVWELFFTNMPAEAQADRHRPREVEREVPEEIRHRQRAGEGAARGVSERDPARLQAGLPRARAERLRAHRPAAGRGRATSGCSKRTRIRRLRRGEDFAASAEKVGTSATKPLLQRIINLGLRWQPESVA